MIFLLSYVLFWFLVYYIEGTHDSYITKETQEHPAAKNYYLANFYKGKWHTLDSIQFAVWHITIAFLLAFANKSLFFIDLQFILYTLFLILISVSVRIVAHDLFYDLGVGRSIFTVPTCQGKWDWWDCTLVWLNKHIGVPTLFLKFIPLFISISIYYIFFLR